MRLASVIAVASATAGCMVSDPPKALPPVASDVDEVRVLANVGCDQPNLGSRDLCSVISDPVQVERVIAFVNSRPNSWSTPWAGAPIHPVMIEFRRGERLVEAFGISSSSFERSTFLSRSASRAEVDEVLMMVDLERSHLRHDEDDPVPD